MLQSFLTPQECPELPCTGDRAHLRLQPHSPVTSASLGEAIQLLLAACSPTAQTQELCYYHRCLLRISAAMIHRQAHTQQSFQKGHFFGGALPQSRKLLRSHPQAMSSFPLTMLSHCWCRELLAVQLVHFSFRHSCIEIKLKQGGKNSKKTKIQKQKQHQRIPKYWKRTKIKYDHLL